MEEQFGSGWITCLDKSMSIWTSHGYCPRKPHPVGNEHHTICCDLSGIMFAIEMVEDRRNCLQTVEQKNRGPPNETNNEITTW